MSLLEQVISHVLACPPRLTVFGTGGIGKSTLGSHAPFPIFIQTEDGLGQLEAPRFPLATKFEQVLEALGELYTTQHPYQTVVIDSLDWLERLIWDVVCKDHGVKSIEKADGGYARGYTHALTHWRKLIEGLDALRSQKGMGILLIAHAKVERFEDPESPPYDRYSPSIHKLASALICEWSDAVLFATRKFRTQTHAAGFGRERTIAVGLGKDGGERILRTVGSPTCVAKCRYPLPAEIPLSWEAIAQGLAPQAGK